jgi:NAD(P)-dependent dehydrogenase (short-subunit alcohol dehydrogenase family)
MFDLHSTRAVVAGGSSGIGLATARLHIECGASVFIIECEGPALSWAKALV